MHNLHDIIPSISSIQQNKENNNAVLDTALNAKVHANLFYQIFEHSPNGIYFVQSNGIMLYFNEAYETYTGLNRMNLIGKHCHSVQTIAGLEFSVADISLTQKKEISKDLFFPKTGKLITISTKFIYNPEDGELIGVIGNLVDITDIISRRENSVPEGYSYSIDQMNDFFEKHSMSLNLVAKDEKMRWVLYYAYKASQTNANILLTGETGVGKEEVARFIYSNSTYKNKTFIAVNCGAIPSELVESELFGYVEGAFTGASKKGKIGYFEAANDGTIFLDEIGELPLNVQASLLRVIQEKQLQRIGSVDKISLNIRIIAATNRNLKQYVDEGKFREDLYYRINVVNISIPPLRERKNDIIPLSTFFLNKLNQESNTSHALSPNAILALTNYMWPGNIRELRNVLERAVMISSGHIIKESDMMFDSNLMARIAIQSSDKENNKNSPLLQDDATDDPTPLGETSLQEQVKSYEYHIMKSYYEHYKSIRAAAKALSMDRSTFQRKYAEYKKIFQ